MRAAFSRFKMRKEPFFFFPFLFFFHIVGIHFFPARFNDLFAGCFKRHLSYFSQHGSIGDLAFGVKRGNKPAGYEIVNAFFFQGQAAGMHPGRDNSMVVRYLFIIEHRFQLRDRVSQYGRGEGAVGRHVLQDARDFRMQVFRQVSSIHPGIGS